MVSHLLKLLIFSTYVWFRQKKFTWTILVFIGNILKNHVVLPDLKVLALKMMNGKDYGHILRMVPTNTEVFCTVYDYVGKADLSIG